MDSDGFPEGGHQEITAKERREYAIGRIRKGRRDAKVNGAQQARQGLHSQELESFNDETVETEIGIATAVVEQAYKTLEFWEENAENRPFYYQA